MPMNSRLRERLPAIVVVIAASVWGLFWIPLRALERHGLDAAWATLGQFVVPLMVLSPLVALRLWRRQPTGCSQVVTGTLIGASMVLYYESLLLTEVVRALVLFYIAPAWGTLLEVFFMGKRFTLWRALALLLGFSGLLVILGVDGGVPLPRGLGDSLALLSGILFAIGALRVRTSPDVSAFEQMIALFLYGSVVALAIALLPVSELGEPPTSTELLPLLPWLVLMAVAFLIPTMWGLMWGSRHVDPGRLGILLQMEAVVGIGSAALLAGEPFGLAEATGSLLVISAGVMDVFGHQRT